MSVPPLSDLLGRVAGNAWDADVALPAEDAYGLIRRQFPELGDGDLRPLGSGWDNSAYLFGGRWVFRFPRRRIAADLVAVELEVLPLVAGRLPLRVPAPLHAGRPAGAYPYPFMGYPLLPGRSACSAELGDPPRRRIAATLGAFLAALHAIHPPPHLNRRVAPVVLSKSDLPGRAADALARIAELEAAGEDVDAQPLRDELLRLSAVPSWAGRPVLVHGDLYACHLLLDERLAVSAVVDWGDTHAGDPALDLSIAYSFLPSDARAALLDGYGEIDADTLARARFRALCYGVLLTHFGVRAGDPAFAAAGRYALAAARS